ncbi:MAG: ABC transporter permease [Bryobacterales bacterium]|nr:ABC transporter permease [Bryobacterales bacterium]
MWTGDYRYVLTNLIMKDFRVRYRNMSLGMLWSLLNPLVMMGVLTFIFTRVFPSGIENFPLFVLCGLVPFNFFSLAWISATTSLVDNTGLVKRVSVPREVIPVAAVLSNCVHLGVQISLLLGLTLLFGKGVHVQWLWLPVVWALFIPFVCGLGMLFAAIDVYIRDTRYVVESGNTVLFWLVPIFYSFENIRPEYADLYRFNPVAALVMATRNILLDGQAPATSLLRNLTIASAAMSLAGWFGFQKLKRRFYDYL